MAPFPLNITAAPESQTAENVPLENRGTIQPSGSQTLRLTPVSLQFTFILLFEKHSENDKQPFYIIPRLL